MSSSGRQHRRGSRGTPHHVSSFTQRSNANNERQQPSGSSNSSRAGDRTGRPEKSVFTFVGERQAQREAAENLPRRRRRTTTGGIDRVRGEHGETPRSSIQNTYRRNLMVTGREDSRSLPSQESRTQSSSENQPNPATFFTLVDIQSTKNIDIQPLSSGSFYKRETSKMSDFKETIHKIDDVPDWIPKPTDSGILQNPPGTPKIGTTESVSSVKKKQTNSLRTKSENRAASSINLLSQKTLDPQELMRKLKEISENRRAYYVQKTGSDDDSLLDLLMKSPQRNSIESLFSLPMNLGRDTTPSTQAIAGSMATLKFIELSKRKRGSAVNATRTESKGGDHKVPHVKKCERFIPPIDVYKKDMIINVPINPLSPVEPHETVDGPSVETVIMINQICEEIDNVFKDIHVGFYDMQEQIKMEEDADKEKENKLFQRSDSDKQLLLELKMSLLPATQSVRRSTDSRKSLQSLGSRRSSRGSSLVDLERSLSQPSLASLLQEPQMDTEELIQILNQKYEVSPELGSHCSIDSHNSENEMKMLYSSGSAHLKRQLSKKTLETVSDKDSDFSPTLSDQKSAVRSNSSGRGSIKNNLRRFTAKVRIPTISQSSITGESFDSKVSENDIQTVQSQVPSQMNAPSKISTIISATVTPSKMKEAEKQAIADMLEVEFGHMHLDTIPTIDDLNTRSQSQLYEVMATYANPEGVEARDIFEGDPQLMVETGTTQQLMLHKAKFPMETITKEQGISFKPGYTDRYKKGRSKKTTSSYETSAQAQEKIYEPEDMGAQSAEECNEWIKFTPSFVDAKEEEIEEEEIPKENEVAELVVDPEVSRPYLKLTQQQFCTNQQSFMGFSIKITECHFHFFRSYVCCSLLLLGSQEILHGGRGQDSMQNIGLQ